MFGSGGDFHVKDIISKSILLFTALQRWRQRCRDEFSLRLEFLPQRVYLRFESGLKLLRIFLTKTQNDRNGLRHANLLFTQSCKALCLQKQILHCYACGTQRLALAAWGGSVDSLSKREKL